MKYLFLFQKKIDMNGSLCDISDEYFDILNEHRKRKENEYDSQFKDFRDIKENEKSKYIDDKFSKLPIHDELKKLDLDNVMMNFDATNLYTSDMWDESSLCLEIETGFVFKPNKNNVYVEAFNFQTFNQDGNENAFFKIIYYNPPDLIFQHLPLKEQVKNIEVNRMRNG